MIYNYNSKSSYTHLKYNFEESFYKIKAENFFERKIFFVDYGHEIFKDSGNILIISEPERYFDIKIESKNNILFSCSDKLIKYLSNNNIKCYKFYPSICNSFAKNQFEKNEFINNSFNILYSCDFSEIEYFYKFIKENENFISKNNIKILLKIRENNEFKLKSIKRNILKFSFIKIINSISYDELQKLYSNVHCLYRNFHGDSNLSLMECLKFDVPIIGGNNFYLSIDKNIDYLYNNYDYIKERAQIYGNYIRDMDYIKINKNNIKNMAKALYEQ